MGMGMGPPWYGWSGIHTKCGWWTAGTTGRRSEPDWSRRRDTRGQGRVESARGHDRWGHGSGGLRRRSLAGGLQKRGRHGLGLDGDIVFLGLGSQHSLGLVSVTLTLAVLLVGVLDADILVHEELSVHIVDRVVAGLEAAIAHETVSLAQTVVVAGDLGGRYEGAEAAEGIIEDLLVDHRVEVSDEELGADLEGLLLIGGGLVDA